jgi:hypothetical protein
MDFVYAHGLPRSDRKTQIGQPVSRLNHIHDAKVTRLAGEKRDKSDIMHFHDRQP